MASPEAYELGDAPWTASKPTLPWYFWPERMPTRSSAPSNTRFSTFRRLRTQAIARCSTSFALNRRTAPQLYLEVIPITQVTTANFALAERAMPVEWALSCAGSIRPSSTTAWRRRDASTVCMPQLAQVIADFHRGANRFLAPETSVEALLAVLKDNETALAARDGRLPADALATSIVEAARRSRRFPSCFRRAPAEAMCATATAICISATSSRSTARRCCSTPSSSMTPSPLSMCSTTSPSC